MHSATKWKFIGVAALAFGVFAFVAGVYFGPQILIAPDTLGSSTTIDYQPSAKPLFTAEDFARANSAIDDFLRSKRNEKKYSALNLRYFVVPHTYGYSTYWYSRSTDMGFPVELKSEADQMLVRALNNHKEAERAAP
jgi:hypothetical protein